MEHSVILLIFIKLQYVVYTFVLSFFEWPFWTGFTVCVWNKGNMFCEDADDCEELFVNPQVLAHIGDNTIQSLTYVEMDMGVLLNSKCHINRCRVEVNMIQFTVK